MAFNRADEIPEFMQRPALTENHDDTDDEEDSMEDEKAVDSLSCLVVDSCRVR